MPELRHSVIRQPGEVNMAHVTQKSTTILVFLSPVSGQNCHYNKGMCQQSGFEEVR